MTTKTTKKTKQTKKLIVRQFGSESKDEVAWPTWLDVTVPSVLNSQALLVQSKRARIRRAHTKERAEVRGGGRKPWRQKGTGRARHGSRRSPIWVGGGITFGPRSRHTRVPLLPKKMRQKALAGVLGHRARNGSLALVRLPDDSSKPKDVAKFLAGARGVLIVVGDDHRALGRVAQNVVGVDVVTARQVSVTALSGARQIYIDETALDVVAARVGHRKVPTAGKGKS